MIVVVVVVVRSHQGPGVVREVVREVVLLEDRVLVVELVELVEVDGV